MLSLIVTVIALHLATGEPTQYKNPFVSKTYLFDRNQPALNYDEAIDYCKSLNGHVLKLQSQPEALWLADHVTDQSAWVGVQSKNDVPDKYLDGTKRTYDNYHVSVFTPFPCSTFAVTLSKGNLAGIMNLVKCGDKFVTICESNSTQK